MKIKKLLSMIVLASITLSATFAVTANATASQASNYVVNAEAMPISYTTGWFTGSSVTDTSGVLVDKGSITTLSGDKFDLLNDEKQDSKFVNLKTLADGNLNEALSINVDIYPGAFYEVDDSGIAVPEGFNTGISETPFGYSFKDNQLLPVITMNTITNSETALSNTSGVTYNQSATAVTGHTTEKVIIGAGYHAKDLILSSFTLSVTGNKNVKAGKYKSDIAINVTYN